jgi:hypothetical protein
LDGNRKRERSDGGGSNRKLECKQIYEIKEAENGEISLYHAVELDCKSNETFSFAPHFNEFLDSNIWYLV